MDRRVSFAVYANGEKVLVVDGYWRGITTRVTSKADDGDYPSSWTCFAYWIEVGGGYALIPASYLRPTI